MSMRIRSFLFCPAIRPDFVPKGERAGADVIVIDLEDSVVPARKAEARQLATASLHAHVASGAAAQLFVRVNAPASPFFADDVHSLSSMVAGIVVPKVEDPAVVPEVRQRLGQRGAAVVIVAGVESVRGVLRVGEITASGPDAVYFGAEDYIADLGGRRTSVGLEVLHPRSAVALSARDRGIVPVDQAVVDLRDDDAFTADAEVGRSLGYRGKICLHPTQVRLANAVFSLSDDELNRAQRIVRAYESGVAAGTAVVEVDGQMIDEALARGARATIAALGDAAGSGE